MALEGFSFVSFALAGTPDPQSHVLRFLVVQFAGDIERNAVVLHAQARAVTSKSSRDVAAGRGS